MTTRKQYRNTSNIETLKFLSLSRKIAFTDELQTYLSSGISIVESLNSIEKYSPDNLIKEIAKNLKKAIESGLTFSQAITRFYKKAFGNTYISLVRAGEDSGELDNVMTRVLTLLKKQDSIKRRIISASTHPAITILLVFVVMIVYAKLVFPKFHETLSMSGTDFAASTQLLVSTATLIGNLWWLIILMFIASIFGAIWLFKIPSVKRTWDTFALSVPFLRDFVKYINLSNFMTVLSVSYESGLPLTQGVDLACETIGNYVMKTKLNKSTVILKQGRKLAESLDSTGVIPHVTISTIAAGEESGFLGKKLFDAAEVLDKKVDTALEALMKLIEPTLLLFLGAVVAFIAIVCLKAYFEVNFAII